MYNEKTFEIAIKNWKKYNSDTSPKVKACVYKELANVKDTVLIQYINSIDTHTQEEEEQEEEQEQKEEEEQEQEYKKILLSKIKISDHSELNKEYYDITMAFFELFRENIKNAGAKTTTIDKAKGTWIDEIRMIVEIDKYNIDDLRHVFWYLKNEVPSENGFSWNKNILSTSKLRQKMDKLKIAYTKAITPIQSHKKTLVN